MKKRILSLAMALVICLGLTVPAFAAETLTNTTNGITITANSDGVLSYTGAGAFTEQHLAVGLELLLAAMAGNSNGAAVSISIEPGITNVPDKSAFVEPLERYGVTSVTINSTPAGTTPAVQTNPKFTDVAATSPFAEAINWAVEQGITKGITDTTFGPSNTCTVSHILTFLWRSAGQHGDSAAAWANELGIDTPDLSAPCTRAAAVTYMWIAAGSPTPSKAASFTDVATDADYAQAVSWAVEKGITSGTGDGTTFSPDSTCTRGQIVTFLYRTGI